MKQMMLWKQWVLIFLGVALLAVSVLVSFAVRATHQFFIISTSAPFANCAAPGDFPHPNQCMGWETPRAVTALGFVGFFLLLGWTILLVRYMRSLAASGRIEKFATCHLAVAVPAAALIVAVHYSIKLHSQAVISAANPAPGGGLWEPVHRQLFGPGLPYAAAVLFAVMYVGSALTMWYIMRLSPSRIRGMKKDQLFQ